MKDVADLLCFDLVLVVLFVIFEFFQTTSSFCFRSIFFLISFFSLTPKKGKLIYSLAVSHMLN